MEYRQLGKTNKKVSVIGLGCEGFIGKSQTEINEMLHVAHQLGINFLDLYSPHPILRTQLAQAIKTHRKDWILQAHLCTIWKDHQYLRTRNIDEVKAGFEDLLQRFHTDYIDIGMIHYVDALTDYETVFKGEILQYALHLKQQGKIKHIGMSSHNPLIALKAVQTGYIDVLMFSINPCYDMLPANEDVDVLFEKESYESPLTNIDPDRQALYEYCEKAGIAITVMKAFGGGDLLDAKLSPFQVAMSVSQCLHYCLTRPGVCSVMAGSHSLNEIQQACAYCTDSPDKRDFSTVLANVPKHSFIGNCVYCGHCAPCPKAIDIASVNKFLDLCIAQGEVVETVREHYLSLEHHASECVSCGSCMRRCPFQVDVVNKMQQAKKLFGK